MKNNGIPKVCFAASSGGHLDELMKMKPVMDKYESFIVTEKTNYIPDTGNTKVHFVKQINRKEKKFPILLIQNTFISIKILLKERPDVIVTTGVLSVIPLCLIGKLFGTKLIYLESIANVHTGTMTGRLLYKFADKFYIQWESLKKIYPKGIYVGGIY